MTVSERPTAHRSPAPATVGRLHGPVRDYAWGSRTAIAAMRGASQPSDGPEAEVWFGAHPAAPALLVRDGATRPLTEVIAADATRELGADVAARFEAHLPFLVKILAAARPLSIQVHPTAAQAREGFAVEQGRGIPLDAPERNYRDTWPKPELMLALTRVDMLCGLHEHAVLADTLDRFGIDELDPLAERIRREGDRGLPRVVADILAWPPDVTTRVISQLVDALTRTPERDRGPNGVRDDILQLATAYPADPGVVVAVLLRRVTLEPETSIALPAGNLHAYLRGVGVEVMATSDNVVRGGLTEKHVDVDELVRLIDPQTRPTPSAGEPVAEGARRHVGPTDHFALTRLASFTGGPDDGAGRSAETSARPDENSVSSRDRRDRRGRGPEVVVCTDGAAGLIVDGETMLLAAGEAAFVSAAARDVHVAGEGDVARVTVGEASTA